MCQQDRHKKNRARDPEATREQDRQFRIKYADKIAEWNRRYNLEHKAEKAASVARWRLANPERSKELGRLSRQKNREAILERGRKANARIRDEVFAAYGGYLCVCCSETEPRVMTIDHVNGNGNEHRRLEGSGVYRALRRDGFPAGFQVLCFQCNWLKAHGGCPLTTNGGLVHHVLASKGD